MSRIPRAHRLSVLTGLSEHCWQAPPPGPPPHLGAAAGGSALSRRPGPAGTRPRRPHPPITAPTRRLTATRLRRLFS